MGYSVHSMANDDIGQINDIDREAFPTQWPPPNYHHELANKLAYYIVVCDDEKKAPPPRAADQVGFGAWMRRRFGVKSQTSIQPAISRRYVAGFAGIWLMADEAHITNIAIRKDYQRRGLGSLLMLSLVELAQELKARIMTLEVRISNFHAQELYSKFGFVRVGLRRGYYIDNREDAMLMSTENIDSPDFQLRFARLREEITGKLEFTPLSLERYQARPGGR